jgi:anaerobic ribonucleoside-triphosphate reductase activating protein
MLSKIDVLVDGRFELKRRDLTLQFRGSSNQRIIDVPKSLEAQEVIIWEKCIDSNRYNS